jgi:hypothetical protein
VSFDRFVRQRVRLTLTALAGAAAGLTCAESVAPDLVVPIQIVATPDRDTLRLADSLVLVVRSDSLTPLGVLWIIEPRADSIRGDTLVYRPSAAGTEYVRALARFPGERFGSTARRVVVLPNAAPIIAIQVSGGAVARVPLGDTIELIAEVADPDGQVVSAEARRWYLEDPTDGASEALIGTGDTLRFPVTAVRVLRFHLIVTDAAGARTHAWYSCEGYDPVTPWRWRTRVSSSWVTWVARHPAGLLLALAPYSGLGHTVVALTDSGIRLWALGTQLTGTPVAVGDDAGIYQSGTSTTGTGQPETRAIKIDADGSEMWTLPGARAVEGPALLHDGGVAIPRLHGVLVVEPNGSERWSAAIDSIGEIRGLSVGGDSTLYVFGYTAPTPRASVSAYTPAGALRWRSLLGTGLTTKTAIPADDSTLLVGADSLHALRADGSVRWSRPGRFSHPAIGNGRLYYALGTDLVAVALATGMEDWRITLPGGAGYPILTLGGDVIVPVGATIMGFDVASGNERWRHVLAGHHTAALLLTDGGDLIAGDEFGFVEAIPAGAGPLASAWPMPWADERRTGRARRP